MVDDLLAQAREQAEQSPPAVRVAAPMRIEREEAAFDLARARATFKKALDDLPQIRRLHDWAMLRQARELAAAALAGVPGFNGVRSGVRRDRPARRRR
jgi:hypothetical protein